MFVPIGVVPMPTYTFATRELEGDTLMNYAWFDNWPFKMTVAAALWPGLESELEQSMTYNLPRLLQQVTMDLL
jgi:hypothetical protein